MAGCQKQKFWVAKTDFVENKSIDINHIHSNNASAACLTMSAAFVFGGRSKALLQGIKMIKLLQWKRVSILLSCVV
jgi:hypothetical protein